MSNVKVIYPHDPLCPALNCIDSGCEDCCRCDLIAKVRQDERINSLGTRVRELKPYADGYCDGERDMLAKCIAAVDARIRPTMHPLENAGIGEALAALRDLREKP